MQITPGLQFELEEYLPLAPERLFNFGYKNLHKKLQSVDQAAGLTPHMFRRGYAKYCYEKGIPIYDLSLSMGHESIDTTSGYIKRTSEDVLIYKIF